MKVKAAGDTLVLRVDKGEELVLAIKKACEENKIYAGEVYGLGAAGKVVFGLYDVGEKRFIENVIEKPLEISSISGNVSFMNGEVYLHIHAVFSDVTGACFGGHLKEAHISATAEVFIRRLDAEIGRFFDADDTGLNLLDI